MNIERLQYLIIPAIILVIFIAGIIKNWNNKDFFLFHHKRNNYNIKKARAIFLGISGIFLISFILIFVLSSRPIIYSCLIAVIAIIAYYLL